MDNAVDRVARAALDEVRNVSVVDEMPLDRPGRRTFPEHEVADLRHKGHSFHIFHKSHL
jgi:hypothetical protein